MAYSLNQSLSDYIYNRFPSIYHKKDKDLQLKGFIESLVEGGLLYSLNEILDLSDLLDVEKCPVAFLPYLMRSYGLEYIADFDETLQRKLIYNISELYSRKGTKPVIEYIVREITGYDAIITERYKEVFRTWSSDASLISKNITASHTYGGSNVYLKYIMGTIYSTKRMNLELQNTVPDTLTSLQVDELVYYIGLFTPASLTYEVSWLVP